jgi:hypothetical protein
MYDDWMLHEERELTRGGHPKPPQIGTYLEWEVEAWSGIGEEIISKSFKV